MCVPEILSDNFCHICRSQQVKYTMLKTKLDQTVCADFMLLRVERRNTSQVMCKVFPSEQLIINGETYTVKSVVEYHPGSMKYSDSTYSMGHYTTSIKTNAAWIKRDDTNIHEDDAPLHGHVFFYERMKVANPPVRPNYVFTSHSDDQTNQNSTSKLIAESEDADSNDTESKSEDEDDQTKCNCTHKGFPQRWAGPTCSQGIG